MRTFGMNQVFQFVECIWLDQKSRQMRKTISEKAYFLSYVRNMFWATILYKYNGMSIQKGTKIRANVSQEQ